MILPDGYSDVPAGKIATIVTSLEMLSPAPSRPVSAGGRWDLQRMERPSPDLYRDLYRRVGQDWLWFSRLRLGDAALAAIIEDPAVEIYALTVDGVAEGLVELDYREPGECELAFFGVTAPMISTAAGRWLMNHAVERAWSRPIRRFWVHTCTLDHPKALAFYVRSGFVPFRQQVEVDDDPRLTGDAPPGAAAHVPVIRSRGS
ncbi:MAG TPA: GNAT family N-acetyltransferase [Aliidongia sp.]|nr:GNAT family N-acetyltransferase [Aliidongia sp.]